ncbi:MAG: cytochrome c assembly protein, partial [Bacteroidota bacterium]
KVAAYNPSTKHYLGRDVFTHIATIPRVEADAEYAREREDSLKYRDYFLRDDRAVPVYDTVIVRDSQVVRTYFLEVEELFQDDRHEGYEAQDGDLAVGLRLKMQDERRDTTFTAEPMVVLRGNLLYTYPVQVQDLSLKVKVDETVLDRYLVPESQLQYDTLVFKIGDQRALSKFDISFRSFNREPSHPSYRPAEGDISVGAILDITNRETGEKNSAEPVYVIRDRQPFNLKDVVDEMGLHIQFVGLDPVAETLSVAIAEHELDRSTFPVELAYSPRTDFVVLEAIVFPGINFFWLGSILMMSGLLISMGVRIGDRRRQARMA